MTRQWKGSGGYDDVQDAKRKTCPGYGLSFRNDRGQSRDLTEA